MVERCPAVARQDLFDALGNGWARNPHCRLGYLSVETGLFAGCLPLRSVDGGLQGRLASRGA